MTNNLEHLRKMSANAMSDMFAAERDNDLERMQNATKNYTALCAAVSAVEKITPKKPKHYTKTLLSRCPSCLALLAYEMKCCDNCGQALMWKEDKS